MRVRPILPLLAALLLIQSIHAQEKLQTVAVLDFVGRGVANIEAEALSERFSSTLARTGAMQLVNRNEMDAILEEQEFQQSGCTDAACAVEIGKLLNVEFMISGSINKIGNTYTLDIKLFSVQSGETSRAESATYQGDVDGLIIEMEIIAYKVMGLEPPADLLAKQGTSGAAQPSGPRPKTRGGAMVRNVVPGLGQLYFGKKVMGGVWLGAEVAALTLFAMAHSNYDAAIADQAHYQALYDETTDVELLNQYRAELLNANDDAASYNSQRTLFAAASGGVWVLSMIHVLLSDPPKAVANQSSRLPDTNPTGLSLHADGQTVGVRYAFHF